MRKYLLRLQHQQITFGEKYLYNLWPLEVRIVNAARPFIPSISLLSGSKFWRQITNKKWYKHKYKYQMKRTFNPSLSYHCHIWRQIRVTSGHALIFTNSIATHCSCMNTTTNTNTNTNINTNITWTFPQLLIALARIFLSTIMLSGLSAPQMEVVGIWPTSQELLHFSKDSNIDISH